jgi:toxin FitB
VYLLDTDVLSELNKRRRNPGVAKWFAIVPDFELHLSVVTLVEIERGIERQRVVDPAFAEQLAQWLELTLRAFGERILPLTVSIARRWGKLAAQIGNKELDIAVAATALENGLTVVTGNTKHFERTGVPLLDPFHARASRK